MKEVVYLVLYRHSGEVFQELYCDSEWMATHLIGELIRVNGYNCEGDEFMIQIQSVNDWVGEVNGKTEEDVPFN